MGVASLRSADPVDGSEAPIKVVYLIAWGRSGSTILGNILGELDGFFHAGEQRTIWGKGLKEGRLCGCGVPVRDCVLWSAVLRRTLDGSTDVAQVVGWQRREVRLRRTLKLLRGHESRRSRPELDAYINLWARLYRCISAETGARVVIDSSKREADAALLGLLPGISPFLVHLVRDPRAVAYSWGRVKASPGEGPNERMLRYRPTVSARNWVVLNLAAEAMRRRLGDERFMQVRYEDFVTRPQETIEAIRQMVAEPVGRLPFVGPTMVRIGPNHTAGGNPGRFGSGTVELREDDEWIRRQGWAERAVTTAIAAPLLRRYGYPFRVDRERVRPRVEGDSKSPTLRGG